MEANRLKLLAIDDSRDNLTTLGAVMRDVLPGCVLLVAQNGPQGIELARSEDPDVILLDIVMPGMDGFEVCRRLKADDTLRAIPVVFLTALQTNRESRVRALEVGAEGFLAKPLDELELMAQVGAMGKLKAANRSQQLEKEKLVERVAKRTEELEHELAEHKRTEEILRQSERMFAAAFRTSPAAITITEAQTGAFLNVNSAFTAMTGFTQEEAVRSSSLGLRLWVDQYDRRRTLATLLDGRPILGQESQFRVKDGRIITGLFSAQLVQLGQKPCILAYIDDITERKQAAEEQMRLLRILESSLNEIYVFDGESLRFSYVNGGARRNLGYSLEAMQTMTPLDLKPEFTEEAFREAIGPLIRHELPQLRFQTVHRRASGSLYPVEVHLQRVEFSGEPVFLALVVDITKRKQVEDEKEKLQAQLSQAQRMESVGRLAGGVAHDFNNLVMGILNYVDLCRDEIPPEHPSRCYLDEITTDAQRSAGITQQLLAFARKQIIAPKVLDLRDSMEGMLKMLRHLMGEDIDLTWKSGQNLWPVRMDPGQLDQILANLCVNARDAIAGVGGVTIETANIGVEDISLLGLNGQIAGECVMLSVSDTGCGMDEDTLDHLYEPFFTTKGVGQGTGLGLATVYGIVEQNQGHIDVQSAPGKGTTFRIYLPRVASLPEAAPVAEPPAELPPGTETILLAEDEKSVRVTSQRFLQMLGYTVLAAETPEEVLRLAETHQGPIHLLVTDVIMPRMNGQDLAAKLAESRPGMKCLFMSGYTADIIGQRGMLKPGVQFIANPFPREVLVQKVREVLDA